MENAENPLTIGIDPGRTGAACLVEFPPDSPPRCITWWAWTWLEGGKRGPARYRVRTNGGEWPDSGGVLTDDGLLAGELAEEVVKATSGRPTRLVLEGLYVPPVRNRQKGRSKPSVNPQAVIPLAEQAGALLGAFLWNLRPFETLRPTASTWRRAILRLPARTKAKDAEEYACAMAPRLVRFEGGELPRGLTMAEEGALAEAACMAVFGGMKK